MSEFTQFDYLLNAMLQAGRADKPAEHGYGDKRKALYAYVRGLEARASLAEGKAEPAPDDATRLDWLMRSVSGAELRRLGVVYPGNCDRAAIDAAMSPLLVGEQP